MTYMDVAALSRTQLVPGKAIDVINRFFGSPWQARGSDSIEGAGYSTLREQSPREEALRDVQERVSSISMHLPAGFVGGLNRQFANMMDEDAWDEDDEPFDSGAVSGFMQLLLGTETRRRPGIGTNGRGSITASWSVGKNRLIVECLPSELVTMVFSREAEGGRIERAAFGPMSPNRVRQVLAPFSPGVWFDC